MERKRRSAMLFFCMSLLLTQVALAGEIAISGNWPTSGGNYVWLDVTVISIIVDVPASPTQTNIYFYKKIPIEVNFNCEFRNKITCVSPAGGSAIAFHVNKDFLMGKHELVVYGEITNIDLTQLTAGAQNVMVAEMALQLRPHNPGPAHTVNLGSLANDPLYLTMDVTSPDPIHTYSGAENFDVISADGEVLMVLIQPNGEVSASLSASLSPASVPAGTTNVDHGVKAVNLAVEDQGPGIYHIATSIIRGNKFPSIIWWDVKKYDILFENPWYAHIIDQNPIEAEEGEPEIHVKQGSRHMYNYSTYFFPNRNIGHSKDVTFTIQNQSIARLLITNKPLTVKDDPTNQFHIIEQPDSWMPPFTESTFTVRFLPTTSGKKTGKIEIHSNDADESQYNIYLIGNGDQFKLTLIADPAVGGSISPIPGTYSYDGGTIVPISATADTGYVFTGWSGDVEDAASASTTVTMNKHKTVTANFQALWGEDITESLIVYCYPTDGSVSVPKNASIQFMVFDETAGIDFSSLNAWVDEMPIVSEGLAVTGGVTVMQQYPALYNFIYLPETPFTEDETVTVHFTCNDQKIPPNYCDTTWSFTIGHTVLDPSTAAVGIIDQEGGTVKNEHLNVSLTIPEDALEGKVVISITAAESLPPLPEGSSGLGLPYHFGPDGLVANEPIIAAIPYTQADLDNAGVTDPADLMIYYFHSTTGEWTQLIIDHVDEVEMLIYVEVNEFCFITLAGTSSTSIQEANALPELFALFQNYPNPFNPDTHIRFNVAEPCRVVLKVYNLLGHELATLVNEAYQPGAYNVTFDASGLPSGIYIYRIQMGHFKDMKKMTILE